MEFSHPTCFKIITNLQDSHVFSKLLLQPKKGLTPSKAASQAPQAARAERGAWDHRRKKREVKSQKHHLGKRHLNQKSCSPSCFATFSAKAQKKSQDQLNSMKKAVEELKASESARVILMNASSKINSDFFTILCINYKVYIVYTTLYCNYINI